MVPADPEIAGLVSGPELARTYSSPGYVDSWQAVEDHQRVLDYAARNPSAGSTAIANRFDLPRGRVRPWLDGSMPDAARAVQTAEQLSWIDVGPESDTFRGLNVLVAWVFSGGSILRGNWTPYFSVDSDGDERILDAAAELVGVTLDFTRSGESGRGRELRAVEHGPVLGRTLVVLGAPRGEKSERLDIRLPAYIETAPERVRREFVQVYLNNRGQQQPDSDVLRFRESRSTHYLNSFARLVQELTGERVSVSERNVILSAPASRAVRSWPALLGL